MCNQVFTSMYAAFAEGNGRGWSAGGRPTPGWGKYNGTRLAQAVSIWYIVNILGIIHSIV